MDSRGKHIGREILAKNLRRLRREQGVTQEVLAQRTELTQTYLSQVESGKRNISVDNISLLANALGVSIDALFDKS